MRKINVKDAALLTCLLLASSALLALAEDREEQQLSVTVDNGDENDSKDRKDSKDDSGNDVSSNNNNDSKGSSSDGKKSESYDYKEALEKSFEFYEAQRSGKLPEGNRVDWRGDAHMDDEYKDHDLTGGYYDAGDFLKITYPLTFALTQLAWSMLEFRNGYEESGQLKYAEQTLQWGLEWLLKAHYDNDDKLVVLVGNPKYEHKSWGRPEDAKLDRPAYSVSAKEPGADAWASAAAAFAAGAVVYKNEEKWSEELIDHAKTLYRFASDPEFSESLYSDTLSGEAAKLYKSTRSADDIAWAALWLYEATGDSDYKDKAEKLFAEALNNRWAFVDVPGGGECSDKLACYWASTRTWNWDNAYPGVMVMLSATASAPNASVYDALYKWLDAWVEGDRIITKTPKGLSCVPCKQCGWGANRNVANAAFLAMVASKYMDNAASRNRYRCWAQSIADYMMGEVGRSLVIGVGEEFPDRPHHRASSCPDKPQQCNWETFNNDKPNAHVLYGGLVSGTCSDKFKDDRTDYETNEVALDKNAGWTGLLAALQQEKYQCRTRASG